MARKNYEIIDRYGNPVDGDIIPDGGKLRVPLMMRDGMSPTQRAVAADKAARFDDSQAKHGPGPIYCDRSAARAAYEAMRAELSDAWKTLTRRKRKAKQYDPFGREVGTYEEEEEDDAASIAYRGQRQGDQCTIDGAPGHLNAKLECVPDPARITRVKYDAAPRTIDAATSRRIKKEAYDQMCAEMRDAWRDLAP